MQKIVLQGGKCQVETCLGAEVFCTAAGGIQGKLPELLVPVFGGEFGVQVSAVRRVRGWGVLVVLFYAPTSAEATLVGASLCYKLFGFGTF